MKFAYWITDEPTSPLALFECEDVPTTLKHLLMSNVKTIDVAGKTYRIKSFRRDERPGREFEGVIFRVYAIPLAE